MSRYDDALQCQMGASNPIPVAMSLREHSLALLRESGTTAVREDPALRLIALQLAHLYGVSRVLDSDDYQQCVDVCLANAEQITVDLWNRR